EGRILLRVEPLRLLPGPRLVDPHPLAEGVEEALGVGPVRTALQHLCHSCHKGRAEQLTRHPWRVRLGQELGVLLEEPLQIDVDQRAVQVEEQGSRRVPAGDGRLQQEEHLRGCPYEARISIIPVRPKVVRAPGSRLERQADVWAGSSVSSFPVGTGSVADGMGSTPDPDRLPALGRGPLVYGAGSLTGHHLLALSSQRKLLKQENAKTARPIESTRGRRPSACSRILVKPPPCLRVGGRPSQALSCRRGTPNGIRTRATALKGRRPRPLDDGGTRPVSG